MKKIFTLSVLASLAFSSYAGEVVYQSALDTSEEFAKWTVIDANSEQKHGDLTNQQVQPNTVTAR